MPTEAVVLKIEDGVAEALGRAAAQLEPGERAVMLDFSSVSRIESGGLRALEDLIRAAGEKGITLSLCGVDGAVYKVLKLMKVAQRLSFVD